MALRHPGSIHPSTLPTCKSVYATSQEEKADRQGTLAAQLPVWRAYLPVLLEKFARIPDPRRPRSIKHKLTVLLTFGLFLFVFAYNSRREANRELTRPAFWELLREVFPEIDTIPHMDTVNRLLAKIEPDQLEEVLIQIIKRILRNRRLQALLVEKHYIIAIDGTQKLVRSLPFAKEALHRQHGEEVSYIAYTVEAVLVGPQGITIPLLTEFCENPIGEKEAFTKQDCELKAGKRLLTRLRKAFPKLRIMIVADGLYANGPMMALCRQLHLDFMFILPQDRLKSIWEEAEGLRKLEKDQKLNYHWGNREQNFWWVSDIDYEFQEASGTCRRLKIHVAGCKESWEEKGEKKEAHWAWVSSRPFTKKNILARCNHAARHRWNIEENILVEKHQGYQYEHAFSLNWTAMKNWHLLMHLGHLLNILTLHAEALVEKVRQLGFRGTIKFLRETWSNRWINRDQLLALCTKPPRIRLAF
ncbi:DDE_Tnp_1-associated [Neomoorella glycerini]|uniref:DDE_Tnp_1-associated n=1 Tax=Neomoorella glycerini TaxID=55779 RepID=A0A6I5ZRV3_9FIRM|nr:transposase family protein [Moorella glycerini]QGP92409.1 DDE_Tnp_1-associated [Moorella glycerini]